MSSSVEIRGIIPAICTPLHEDESINVAALGELVRRMLAAGVHGIFAVGSMGEGYALGMAEREVALSTVVDEVAGTVPVLGGAGAITTKQSIEQARLAAQCGVDALSVITPHFIVPSQEELYRHYCEIAEATQLPCLLYNHPTRCHVHIHPDTAARLEQAGAAVGLKDSSGDLANTIEYVMRCSPSFAVMNGHDALIYSALVSGAKGSVAATANVVPALLVGIYDAVLAGDLGKARAAQARLTPLRHAFSLGSGAAVLKTALRMMGLQAGPPARPSLPLDTAAEDQLRQVLRALEVVP